MNEFERRVVHRALSDAKDIDTDSHGYGTFRKIRIQPD
jgi:predicted RNA-binding protein Jag